MIRYSIVLCLFWLYAHALYPQKNEYRQYDQLDGTWTFVREPANSYGIGLSNNWHLLDLRTFSNATVMPVPSAYNELVEDIAVYRHVGWVWYQTQYTPSYKDASSRTFLRFESVQYFAVVFLNDKQIGNHTGGHLPFEFEVSLNYGQTNVITVAVNNTLSQETVPTGEFKYFQPDNEFGYSVYPEGFFEFTPDFDFFNYAGILRSVYLIKLSNAFISDLHIIADDKGSLSYAVTPDPINGSVNAIIKVRPAKGGNIVYSGNGLNNSAVVPNVDLWWPRGYGDPNLYVIEVSLLNNASQIVDIYRETFGFRTSSVSSNSILINGKPFYCHGFAMHEDFEVHGRGFNPVVMHKDLNTLEWLNGNCYRTSHYPYAEERAYEADRRGIVTFTEAPGVELHTFSEKNMYLHGQMLTEMINRDKNHPSVMLWSIANEPQTWQNSSRAYFSYLINVTHRLDKTRPAMIVFNNDNENNDKVADLVDLIGVNRYYAWYSDMGYLDTITDHFIINVLRWRRKFNKPIMLTEYGADAIAGLVREPGTDFTEQYQAEFVKRYHAALDVLIASGNITGEMMWNFADFMTAQSTTRAVGNHKGALTRTRQPKMVAYVLQERYAKLMQKVANTTASPTQSQVSSTEVTTPSQINTNTTNSSTTSNTSPTSPTQSQNSNSKAISQLLIMLISVQPLVPILLRIMDIRTNFLY